MISTQRQISGFFDWCRARVDNLAAIAKLGELFGPEQHVLIAAGIDSLANFWGKLYPDLLPNRRDATRMGAFLVVHGGEIFQRVSGPDLDKRALKLQLELPVREAIRNLGLPLLTGSEIRVWRDDPTLDESVDAAKLAGLALDSDWFRESRYGEILYRKYRCNWVHELDGSDDLSTRQFSERTDEPHYDNRLIGRTGRVKKRLVFTASFLTRAYSEILHSFERQCLADDKVPAG